MPRNSEGRYITLEEGAPVPVDDFGRPLDSDGQILPTNSAGEYVYVSRDEGTPAPTPTRVVAEAPITIAPVSERFGFGWLSRAQFKLLYSRRAKSKHCFISGFMELLLVFDTSNNVKILDYRVMKEAVKLFLLDNFDLNPNRVRVGLVKYGDSVEVPIALGDYGSESELVSRIGETRRLKGRPDLDKALREAASEFALSGVENVPRVVIVWRNGNSKFVLIMF